MPGGFEDRIALLTGLSNGKLPSPRAKGNPSRRLTATQSETLCFACTNCPDLFRT
jgi:hypothetical protein